MATSRPRATSHVPSPRLGPPLVTFEATQRVYMYVYAGYISSHYTIPQFRPFYRDPRWRRFQPGFCRNNIARPALAVTQFNLLGLPPPPNRTCSISARARYVSSTRLPAASPYFLSFRAPRNRFHRGQYRIFPETVYRDNSIFFLFPASSFIFHTLRARFSFSISSSLGDSPDIRHFFFSFRREAARTRRVPIDIWGSYLNKFPKKKIRNYSKDCYPDDADAVERFKRFKTVL